MAGTRRILARRRLTVKYKIKYLDLALTDVREIKKYLLQFYQSTVTGFLAELKEKIFALGDFPYLCEKYIYRPSYRKMIVSDYLVFYKVNEKERTVEIHRILHGAVNITRRLR